DAKSPIGRGGTVWNNPLVHPDDQGAWQWLPEPETSRLTKWADSVQEALPRLPEDSILYDLYGGLGGDDLPVDDPLFQELLDELNRCTLRALQRATPPGAWVYAID